jgi:pimeloyl-ACP methyl ester carboxylesterase
MWKGYRSEKELTVDSLSDIRQPTLLLYEESTIFFKSYEILSERLSNCKPVLLSDGNLKHFTVLENPAELLAETRAFLAAETAEGQQVAR